MVSIRTPHPTLIANIARICRRFGQFLIGDAYYTGYGWNYSFDPNLLPVPIVPTEHTHNDPKTDEYRRGYALGAGVALHQYRGDIPRTSGHLHEEMDDYGEPDWAEGYCAGYNDMWETFS